MNTPELHTERLRLRRFREHDASDMEAFFRIYSDVETNTFLPWFPVRNMDEARAMFQERYAAVYEKEQGYAYAICLFKEKMFEEAKLWAKRSIEAKMEITKSRELIQAIERFQSLGE